MPFCYGTTCQRLALSCPVLERQRKCSLQPNERSHFRHPGELTIQPCLPLLFAPLAISLSPILASDPPPFAHLERVCAPVRRRREPEHLVRRLDG